MNKNYVKEYKESFCLIDDLAVLKESSNEAVINLSEFSDFKKYMHVKRKVEDELYNIIENSSKSDKAKLILVCGGVGDGKSHLISYFKNQYPEVMSKFKLHNDATESFEPNKTSIDTLNDILEDFSDDKVDNSKSKVIIAINLGTLSNFIDSEYGNRFLKLKKFIKEKEILDLSISENSYSDESVFQFINFSDYKIYSLTKEKAKSDYIKNILIKIVKKDSRNKFRNSYENKCLDCKVRYKCPVKFNYEMLMQESVQEATIDLLIESIVKNKLIVSTRSILNFIYDFLINSKLDNMKYDERLSYINNMKYDEFLECLFTSNIFDHKEMSSILESINKIDPIILESEELDKLIIKLNISENKEKIFNQYIKIEKENYLSEIMLNSNKEIKDQIINTFIRLNLFIPNEKINLKDKMYIEFMKNVYYFNKGEKNELKEIYKNVKNAIYNWNGDCEIDKINLYIGKNQVRYRLSQSLEIKSDLNNLKENENDEIFKFNQNIILNYKNESKGESYSIDIDFNLYDLLMRVKNGYRPNKDDKYNYINFVEFINKVEKLGNQNKEIFIEDRFELNGGEYKFTYDEDFDEFKFIKVN